MEAETFTWGQAACRPYDILREILPLAHIWISFVTSKYFASTMDRTLREETMFRRKKLPSNSINL